MNASKVQSKSLYRELTVALAALVTLVSISVSLLNYYYSSRETDALFESKASVYTANLRESLEWPLWNIDDDMIVKIGSAFASNDEIASLTIRDDQLRVVYQHQQSRGNQLKRAFVIEHDGKAIGTVEIGLSLRAYEDKNRWLLFTGFATAVLLIVSLLGVMRWMLTRLLKSPVDALVGAINGVVDGSYPRIELAQTYSEFSPIVSGFMIMSAAVASREASLRASEQKLLAILEGVDACIYLKDTEGRYLFANRSVRELWQVEMADIVGFGDEKFFDEQTAEHIRLTDKRVLIDGETLRVEEINTVAATGETFFYQSTKLPLHREDGSIYALCGISVDITERKRIEAELRESEQRYHFLFNNNPLPMWIFATDSLTFLEVNDRTVEHYGYTRDELHRMTIRDIRPAEDIPELNDVLAHSTDGVVVREARHKKKDGTVIDVIVSTMPMMYGSTPARIVLIQDITERKRAAEQLLLSQQDLAAAQRIAHLASWSLDLATNQVVWSDELYKMYDLDPSLPPPHYSDSMKLFTPASWEQLSAAIAQTVQTGLPYTLELETVRKDDGRGWMFARGELVRDAQGSAAMIRGVAMDITERKQAEEELRKYKDHLEEEVQLRTTDLVLARNAADAANRAKSVFLANMSHELRTPLNAILGFSGMMRKSATLTQEQRNNLDIINRSGEYLLSLINDVLEMAKIEAGRVQLESAPFDLGMLVRDVTDMMQVRAREKDIQLLIDQSSEFPRYIRGDEARLRQVLINLVGNAVKFTRQGGVIVRLGMKPDVPLQRLLIEVEDTGPGIEEADQQRIFEPFVQVGESTTQKGTGLGLTITRQFVQMMGGAISLESMPGKGSIFRVELPVEMVDKSTISKPGSVINGTVTGLIPGQPEYRILIVEDQLENQMLLTNLMKPLGFQVRVAQNGKQGVELFQSWHPHLIWMDRRMPVMDGIEATHRIRALPGGMEVKIVAVTASAFMEQRDEMLAAGMDEFVRKPYRFDEIYDCLARQLGVHYTYAEVLPAEEMEGADLSSLASLPEVLRHELQLALESLEMDRIAAAIGQVATIDAKLYTTLNRLAGNFDYPAILEVLQGT